MKRIVTPAALALLGCCAIGLGGLAQETPELTNAYDLVVCPDFRTELFDSWADVIPTSVSPWVRIRDIDDPGVEIIMTSKGGFRLIGTSSGKRICEQPGECYGTQTGYNSFAFNADDGFEIAVLFRQNGASASFKVELHSSGKYAHATLVCSNDFCSLYTCCTNCYGSENCMNAGYRTWSDPRWWRDEAHVLGLIYEPETRLVRAHVDGQYWIGIATMPVELSMAHLRLFAQCDPEDAETVDYEILAVVMGLGRE